MITSTLGCCGSVNRRNFIPVNVWKQVRRNRADSRTSIPVRVDRGSCMEAGVSDLVIAWTLVRCELTSLTREGESWKEESEESWLVRTHEMYLRGRDSRLWRAYLSHRGSHAGRPNRRLCLLLLKKIQPYL